MTNTTLSWKLADEHEGLRPEQVDYAVTVTNHRVSRFNVSRFSREGELLRLLVFGHSHVVSIYSRGRNVGLKRCGLWPYTPKRMAAKIIKEDRSLFKKDEHTVYFVNVDK